MDEDKATPNPVEETATTPETPEVALEEERKKLQAERDALYDQLLRRQADFENYKKRMERDQQEFRERAEADLVLNLLPVLDAFERALNAAESAQPEEYRKGIELIYKQLLDTLARRGLKPVKALGETFDPFLHHALEKIETVDHRDQEVMDELQRGYCFKDRLLRPALVKVAVRPKLPEEKSQ
ncbi:MAG: nucleotide exchange factor GrpE [Acidobacteria bacterium]|nr:nucleotide exchange factor GrpE [Acidobacteriota bacterium]